MFHMKMFHIGKMFTLRIGGGRGPAFSLKKHPSRLLQQEESRPVILNISLSLFKLFQE